jgi:HEAT repeat protein
MIELGDFQPYIQSILDSSNKNGDWGDRYIPTQAELPLRVQTYESSSNELEQSQSAEKKQREQFAVLDGLRKYAPEQVLLVGKPGSGKSTALRRLRWEAAERCAKAIEQNQDMIPPIPVLLELRSLDGSVLELLRETLEWSGVDLEEKTLKTLLREKQFLLLLDGVNELQNDSARQAVGKFRQLCASARVPLIFTTRELGAGFDLGVSRKLEMLPLSETQMRDFVQKQLSEQGDVLLRQVQGRLRELAETPLLLKLLCEVFRHNQHQVPRSRGEMFRMFARDYDQIKPWDTVAASPGFREFRDELLRELAAAMMQGEQPTGLRLQIGRDEAEQILEKSLAGRVEAPGSRAKEWLGDLIKHHLLQMAADRKQIEFHHQLFQEYYAAEWLFLRLKDLSDEALKYHYLNYLKWTESLAMMMAFLQSEQQAEHFFKLALDVDWYLAARLAGEVKLSFQAITIGKIIKLKLPKWVKNNLLGETRSDVAIPELLKALDDDDLDICRSAAEALGNLDSEKTIPGLIKALQYEDLWVRCSAIDPLRKLGSEEAIPGLLKALVWGDSDIQRIAAEALGEIGSEQAIPELIKAITDEDSEIWWSAAEALGKIGSELAIPELIESLQYGYYDVQEHVAYALGILGPEHVLSNILKDLEDKDFDERWSSANILGYLGSDQAVPGLLKALKDRNFQVRWSAAEALGKIGSLQAIPGLIKALDDKKSHVRWAASEALAILGSEQAIPGLIKALEDRDSDIRFTAVTLLGKFSTKQTVLGLLKAVMSDSDSQICWRATESLKSLDSDLVLPEALKILKDKNLDKRWKLDYISEILGALGAEQAIPALIKNLTDEYSEVRRSAVKALGILRAEQAIPEISQALEDKDSGVRKRATEALRQLGAQQAIPRLCEILKDKDPDVRLSAAITLGQLGSEHAIPGLLEALQDKSFFWRHSVVNSMENINNVAIASILPHLIDLIPTPSGGAAFSAMSVIQSNCKLYNYNIAQSPPPKLSIQMSKRESHYTVNSQKNQIFEYVNNYIENNYPNS